MSSPDQAPPPVPDDDDYSPEPAPPGSTPAPDDPTELDQSEPDQTEPDQTEPDQAEPDQAEPGHVSPGRAERGRATLEPIEPDPAQPELPQAELPQAEPEQVAPADEPYVPDPTMDELVRTELVRRTELIAAEHRAIAQAQARQAERLVELQLWSEDPRVSSRLHGSPEGIHLADRNAATLTDDQARAVAYGRWEDREVARRTIVSETACLLKLHERTVERLMDESLWLCSASATFDALTAGEISYPHAKALIDQMRSLPAEDQAAFEEKVLPEAKTLPVGRFINRARRVREKQHPESIITRSRTALAERRSYWEAAADGMGWLHWHGTAHDTKAAFDRIDSLAVSLKRSGDPTPTGTAPAAATATDTGTGTGTGRGTETETETGSGSGTGPGTETRAGSGTGAGGGAEAGGLETEEQNKRGLDQLRADITRALLLDGITPDGLGAGICGTVMITVPVLTLLGRDEEPATLEGYGPISPETARDIAAHAPSFTRLLTHPETGVVLSLGRTQHKNTKAMKKWLRMRDETCRFPGCSRPAVTSDVDHTDDWAGGGKTDSDNLAHVCEPHHRLKHLSKWQVTQEPGGVLLWTSPGKRSYRTDPANPVAPPRPRPPVVTPKPRKRPAANTYLLPEHQPTRRPSPPVPENPPF